MAKTIDLSIIVVNFNTPELTVSCLDSIANSNLQNNTIEIIVIDNGSTDASGEVLEQLAKKRKHITIILNRENKGFAAANNQGIRYAKGKYILLLNSDTEVSPQTIAGLLEFMEKTPDAGVATAKLVLVNGKIDPASHRGFPTPWAALTYFSGAERMFPTTSVFGGYHQGYKDMTEPHEVDCISGAFFLVRKEVVAQIGLLDEQFFMYGEDIDWCMRIKKSHWKIYYHPEFIVLHKKKQSGRLSSNKFLQKSTNKHFYDAMNLFYAKHYQHSYGWFTKQLVLLGIKLRSLV